MNNTRVPKTIPISCIHNLFFEKYITKEEKIQAANNIIINYELCLNADQLLMAFEKILKYYGVERLTYFGSELKIRIFLFDNVLNINKNMYIAIILALCKNFSSRDLVRFIKFIDYYPVDIGFDKIYANDEPIEYYQLLNYYEFDVSNIDGISEEYKQKIQDYRAEKYANKLTKRAIKN